VKPVDKVNLAEKLALIHEHWRPKVVGELNGQEVKLVKFQGEFVWHTHAVEDELFLVIAGSMRVEFRDRVVTLNAGEFCIVPHGMEHRTAADNEAQVLLFEPAATRNTGDVADAQYTAPNGVKI
jgi:mannose-6-phosphate isomerase-like protein (cupin superfamily)